MEIDWVYFVLIQGGLGMFNLNSSKQKGSLVFIYNG